VAQLEEVCGHASGTCGVRGGDRGDLGRWRRAWVDDDEREAGPAQGGELRAALGRQDEHRARDVGA